MSRYPTDGPTRCPRCGQIGGHGTSDECIVALNAEKAIVHAEDAATAASQARAAAKRNRRFAPGPIIVRRLARTKFTARAFHQPSHRVPVSRVCMDLEHALAWIARQPQGGRYFVEHGAQRMTLRYVK